MNRNRLCEVSLCGTLLAIVVTAAYADLGDQLFKLLPDDGAEFNWFGESVALSGATAIVGARHDDDNGFNSGSAYRFDLSDPANPTQLFKLLPDDGAADAFFGISVAISRETTIVGAHGDDDNGSLSGSAYLFDTITGRQVAKLLANDGAAIDYFGASVAISPDGVGAIVGAHGDDDNGTDSGSAYLFDITTGRQIAKLLPDDGAPRDSFGGSVAISGATAVVGALRDDDNGFNSGSVYVFDVTDSKNPVQIAKLLANDGAANDYFGISVAISGPPGKEVAIVGATGDDDNGSASGSAYLFDTTTGRQITKLLPDDGAANEHFGISVAISGPPGKEVAIVGANGDDENGDFSGSAYLFDTATGRQIAKLLPDDGAAGDVFGGSVAISGATAMVGARFDDDNGTNSGSAYLFDATGAPACPCDLDGDGVVGITDLLILLGSWGACADCDVCPADLDGDCTVGILDLLTLLANWG